MVLLLVCENYGRNPFSREIFAFRGKGGDIVPVVSYDGWCKIVRSQKDFDGVSFRFSDSVIRIAGCMGDLPEYVECSIRLKGIGTPVTVQEYMVECFNDRSPVWKRWPRRMLRTRSFIQCARLAFSLTGLYDEGDAWSEEGLNGFLTLEGIQSQPEPRPEAVSQSLTPTDKPNPAAAMPRPALDGIVAKLTAHAVSRANGWMRAFQWVEANLSGADRRYAEAALTKKQLDMSPALSSASSVSSASSASSDADWECRLSAGISNDDPGTQAPALKEADPSSDHSSGDGRQTDEAGASVTAVHSMLGSDTVLF